MEKTPAVGIGQAPAPQLLPARCYGVSMRSVHRSQEKQAFQLLTARAFTTTKEASPSVQTNTLFSNVNPRTIKAEPGSVRDAALLVGGATVGAGILALPAVTQVMSVCINPSMCAHAACTYPLKILLQLRFLALVLCIGGGEACQPHTSVPAHHARRKLASAPRPS